MTNNGHPFDLSGLIACVTGASSGIGCHIASYLASQGAQVIGVARREDELIKWQQQLAQPCAYVAADLTDLESLADVANRVSSTFGAPDILINAAGINTRQHANDVDLKAWNTTMNLNLGTPFFLAQHFVPHMSEKKWGRIINIASLQSYRAFPSGIAYGASKSGITQLTRAMAEAWSSRGINANAIGPGFVRTELTETVFADKERAMRNAEQTCIGRNSELSDLEGPIHFLCARASDYVTGQVLMVDGGFTAK